MLARASSKLLRCSKVKLPAETADMRATHLAGFFTPNTRPELPGFTATVHVSVTNFFLMPPPLSVCFFSCSDITEIVRDLKATKAPEDGAVNTERLKKLTK
jgi:hypothetical protein